MEHHATARVTCASMLMEAFDPESVRRALALLGDKARLAFGLLGCERLLPNYMAFAREARWGTPRSLRAALDLAWGFLEGLTPAPEAIQEAQHAVQQAEPETGDFDTILVSSALDAAVSAGLVLQFIRGGDLAAIVDIAVSCRDTVDMFVQDLEGLSPSDPTLEERILQHPLMQQELKRQHDDLRMLRAFSGEPVEVAALRQSWRSQPRSNIGLSG